MVVRWEIKVITKLSEGKGGFVDQLIFPEKVFSVFKCRQASHYDRMLLKLISI
jgi:hypothetical protein